MVSTGKGGYKGEDLQRQICDKDIESTKQNVLGMHEPVGQAYKLIIGLVEKSGKGVYLFKIQIFQLKLIERNEA